MKSDPRHAVPGAPGPGQVRPTTLRGLVSGFLGVTLVVLLFLSLGSVNVTVESTPSWVSIRPDQPRQMLGAALEILEDPGRAWTLQDVLSPGISDRFVRATTPSPAFGYTRSAYWVRFRIRSEATVDIRPVIQLETSRFAELDWYAVTPGGRVVTPAVGEGSGSRMRSLSARLPAIGLDLRPGQEVWIYLRAWTPSSTFFPIFVHSDTLSYAKAVVIGESLWLPCLGIVLTVALISIYFAFLFKERLFFINALLIFLYCTFLAIHSGYWEWLGWVGSPGIKWQPMLSFSQLNSLTILWFTIDYFQVDVPASRRRWGLGLTLAGMVAALWLPYQLDAQLTNGLALLAYGVCFVIAVRCGALRPGPVAGRFGTHLIGIAWLADTAFMTLLIVQWNGWMPVIVSPPTGLLYPAAVSPLLVLAAIADRFYQLMQTKLRLQALEQSLSEARFQALRYQMNPHFLYNALNSVRGLLLESPKRADDFVTRLALFLRSSLHVSQETLVPLYRELEILGNYLDVEKVRFEDRLDVEVAVPDGLAREPVPELILQPLVENAIKHGSFSTSGWLRIRVTVSAVADRLLLEVSNSGQLRSDTASAGSGSRVGLENLRRRLDLVFPGRGQLLLVQEGDRVVARVTIPRTGPDAGE